jgi:hypothetical protein
MNKNEVDLGFGIFDFDDISHDDITQQMGIEPCYQRIKGEKRNPRNPNSPLWDNNSWHMKSGLDKDADFDKQMSAMLDIIEQKLDVLKPLCAKYYTEFSCALFVYRDNGESTPSVHLNNRYNKIASTLNIEFDVDLYVF